MEPSHPSPRSTFSVAPAQHEHADSTFREWRSLPTYPSIRGYRIYYPESYQRTAFVKSVRHPDSLLGPGSILEATGPPRWRSHYRGYHHCCLIPRYPDPSQCWSHCQFYIWKDLAHVGTVIVVALNPACCHFRLVGSELPSLRQPTDDWRRD